MLSKEIKNDAAQLIIAIMKTDIRYYLKDALKTQW